MILISNYHAGIEQTAYAGGLYPLPVFPDLKYLSSVSVIQILQASSRRPKGWALFSLPTPPQLSWFKFQYQRHLWSKICNYYAGIKQTAHGVGFILYLLSRNWKDLSSISAPSVIQISNLYILCRHRADGPRGGLYPLPARTQPSGTGETKTRTTWSKG